MNKDKSCDTCIHQKDEVWEDYDWHCYCEITGDIVDDGDEIGNACKRWSELK